MRAARIFIVLLCGIVCYSIIAEGDQATAPFYAHRTNLLVVMDDEGKEQPVRNMADWQRRRDYILANMQLVMGPLPRKYQKVPLDVRVLEEENLTHCTRRKVSYQVDLNDRLNAYLLLPHQRRTQAPAMLCLHQTTEIGKDSPAGRGGDTNLHYALELAERGFVTLAPDYWNFGDYRHQTYDPLDHGYVSGTMKGIWNHIRSIDLLVSLAEVDTNRIGCIGHSLGGHNTLWLAAFDQRVKVAVTSCGFSSMSNYAASAYGGGDLRNYAQRRYMPRIASHYDNDPRKLPFDWPEVLATLAPRPVFINAPLQDKNFEMEGVKECLLLAQPVYDWMGAGRQLRAIHPDTGHTFPVEAREAAYQFIQSAFYGSE